MKIIHKHLTPNGVNIQLEDWREDNLGFIIGAYPIARQSGKYGFVMSGSKFRLSIPSNRYTGYTEANVVTDYDLLIKGKKTLEDLANHFYYGEKDRWYLGMFQPGTDEWYKAREKYGI